MAFLAGRCSLPKGTGDDKNMGIILNTGLESNRCFLPKVIDQEPTYIPNPSYFIIGNSLFDIGYSFPFSMFSFLVLADKHAALTQEHAYCYWQNRIAPLAIFPLWRADAVEATGIICPLGIVEIGTAVGERIGLDGIPNGVG